MKKMFKLFMCAAVVAAGFTACSEEVNPINPEPDETETGLLTVKFVNPATYADPTDNGTADETAIRDVTIFVFKPSGLEIEKTFLFAELENGTKAAKIAVTLGDRTVYAGINLTDQMKAKLRETNGFNNFVSLGTTDASSNKFTPTIAEIQNLYKAKEFPMFSAEVKSVTIVPVPTGGSNNEVTIALDRLVAKITVRQGSEFLLPDNLTADGAKFDPAVTWDMGNLNGKIYPYAKANGGKDPNYEYTGSLIDADGLDYRATNFVNNFDKTTNSLQQGYKGYSTTVDLYSTVIGSRKANYAPENNSLGKKGHETTYASIRAKFAPTQVYTYTAGDPEPKVATGDVPNIANSDPFFVVTYTQTYYFRDKDQAEAYKAELISTGKKTNAEVKPYVGQYCYYPLYLGMDKRETQRNHYYDITLNKFTGLGDPTGEIPEEDGDQPADKSSLLDVTISINPWTVDSGDYPLGK
jgi:hypothetical protein